MLQIHTKEWRRLLLQLGEGEPACKYHCALLGAAPFPFQPCAWEYLADVPFFSDLSFPVQRLEHRVFGCGTQGREQSPRGDRGSPASQARGMRDGSKGALT